MWRKSGSRITDISQVVKVGDVKIDGEEDIYFKHDFTGLQSKVGTAKIRKAIFQLTLTS